MLCPEKLLGIAEDSGDEFTHYIRTESRHPNILIRSNTNYIRVNIRKDNERVSNEPQTFSFWIATLVDGPSKPYSVIVETPSELILLLHAKTSMPPDNNPINLSESTENVENKKDSRYAIHSYR